MLCSIVAEIDPNAMDALKELRLQHLKYIQQHLSIIRSAGPAHDRNGLPKAMIMTLAVPELKDAEEFAQNHPFVRSNRIFQSVEVREWSQIIPEIAPGFLAEEILKEERQRSGPC